MSQHKFNVPLQVLTPNVSVIACHSSEENFSAVAPVEEYDF